MKKNYKVLIIATLFILPNMASSQQLELEWYNQFGAEGWDYANASLILPNGDHVVAGTCSLLNESDSLSKKLYKNGWIVCLDSLGNKKWEKFFRASDFVTISSLTNRGNEIFFSGLFNDTLYFDSTSYLNSDSYMSSFYGHLNINGELIIFNKFGNGALFKDILVSSDSNSMYIVSTFSDTLTLNNLKVIPRDDNTAIICKVQYNAMQDFIEICRLSGGTMLNIRSIVSKDSTIFLAGNYCDSIRFQDSVYFSSDQADAFIASLNQYDQNAWIKFISGKKNQLINKICLTPTGDIGVIGSFQESSVFLSDTLNSIGCYDILIYFLDSSGNVKWSKRLGNISNDYGYTVTCKNNVLFLSGSFAYNLEIPTEFGNSLELTSLSPFGNSFIAKYSYNGILKTSCTFPGTSEDYCVNLNILNDKITAIGNFYDKLNLVETDGNVIEINSKGDKDVFILHFDDLCHDYEINAGNDTIVCEGGTTILHSNEVLTSFLWEPGGELNSDLIISDPGKYFLTGINENGCIAKDSLFVKQSTLAQIYAGQDTTIVAGDQLNLVFANCSDSIAILNWSSTGSGYFGNQNSLQTYYSTSFNDISTGAFQLKLEGVNFCGSSADSLYVIIQKDNDGITAYPNPTQDIVTLICDEGITISDITITTQSGYILLSNEPVNNYFFTYNLAPQMPGTYLFYINTNDGLKTKVINKI